MGEMADDRTQNDEVLDLNAAGSAGEGGSEDRAAADSSGHTDHGFSEEMR